MHRFASLLLPALWMGVALPDVIAEDFSVGVISGDGTCPAGSEQILHGMDEEDDYCGGSTGSNAVDSENYTMGTWSRGWTGALSTYSAGSGNGSYRGGVVFRWCEVDGTQFKPLTIIDDPSRNYAVLKLGSTCPPGSEEFWRLFDNEDGGPFDGYHNSNWVMGDVSPNSIGTGSHGNTRLHFCLFRSGPFTMTKPPNLGVPYGVFALPSFAGQPFPFALASGLVHTNEELDWNANQFWGGAADADARRIIHPIDGNIAAAQYTCGSMTVLNVVQVSSGAEPRCGSCGGTVLPSGACSVPTPPNHGMACGAGGAGHVLCDGRCTIGPSPVPPAIINVVSTLLLSD